MRELNLNGYIDDESWFGDEITPEDLHSQLYGETDVETDDVHIRLNSYGGSCNAATRMFDDMWVLFNGEKWEITTLGEYAFTKAYLGLKASVAKGVSG